MAETIFVHVCRNNPAARRLDLLAGENRRVERMECLDECTVCERQPFAFVQGELVRAATCEALAKKVDTQISRRRARRR